MASTPNKNYNNQNTGANVNTWGIVNNSNFSIVDLNFGGRLNLGVGGSANITVTANQAQNLMHVLTGVLLANIQYIFPALGGIYMVRNDTTGAFNLTVMCAGGSTGAVVPQGNSALVFINPDDLSVRCELIGADIFHGLGSTAGAAAAMTINVDGGPFRLGDGVLTFWRSGFNSVGGGTTLNIQATGALALQKDAQGGIAALAANDVVQNCFYLSAYSSVLNTHILLNPTLNLGNIAPLNIGENLESDGAGGLRLSRTAIMATGVTAVTQGTADNSTKLATTAYIDRAGNNSQGLKTISSGSPSGGSNGDVWYQL